jgi:hypothetical protein
MPSLSDIFNPTLFIFLGVLVLVAALLVVYFESKIRDQNHKISSMFSLVSTLAEDINNVKFGLNHLAHNSFGGAQENSKTTLDNSNTNKNNEDINISKSHSKEEDSEDSPHFNDYENELERLKYIRIHGYFIYIFNNLEIMMK